MCGWVLFSGKQGIICLLLSPFTSSSPCCLRCSYQKSGDLFRVPSSHFTSLECVRCIGETSSCANVLSIHMQCPLLLLMIFLERLHSLAAPPLQSTSAQGEFYIIMWYMLRRKGQLMKQKERGFPSTHPPTERYVRAMSPQHESIFQEFFHRANVECKFLNKKCCLCQAFWICRNGSL